MVVIVFANAGQQNSLETQELLIEEDGGTVQTIMSVEA